MRAALLPRLAAILAVDAKMIAHPRFIGRAVALAELPARPLPDRVATDFGFDLGFAHPGVVIPRGVVGADMVEAEPVVIVELDARPRCAEIPGDFATGVVAQPSRRLRLGNLHRFERDTSHGLSMGSLPRC